MTTETGTLPETAPETREPLPLEPRERTASDVLRAAARYIEEHGWTRYTFNDPDGRVCVLGAIKAIGDSREGWPSDKLRRYLGVDYITSWNDTPGRTEAEILAALRAAADRP